MKLAPLYPMTAPNLLYHYTSRETALEKILPKKELRIGSLGDTNDPRETKEWGFVVARSINSNFEDKATRIESFESINLLQQVANNIRRQEWWALCMTQDDPDLVIPNINQIDFTHFKYGHARGRMWAQYADKHRGVCLVFDGNLLHDAIVSTVGHDSLFFDSVRYVDEFDLKNIKERGYAFQFSFDDCLDYGFENGIRKHIKKYYQHYFLEKSLEWGSEVEFRCLVNRLAGPYSVDISTALRTVIVGVDFPVVYGPSLWRLCDELGVKVERMHWNNRIPTKQAWAAE